jgi:hypothetical protein
MTRHIALTIAIVGSVAVNAAVRTDSAQAQWITTKTCTNCGRQVSPAAQVGQRCPYCGATWGFERWSQTFAPSSGAFVNPPITLPPQNQFGSTTAADGAVRRLDHGLKEDERRARGERDRLTRQRGELLKFLNGFSTPLSQASFRRAKMSLEQTPEMVRLLQALVPPLAVREFEFNDGPLWGLVRRDGSLVDPPHRLAEPSIEPKLNAARYAFDDCWADLATELLVGHSARADRIAALAAALDHWRATFDTVAKNCSRLDAARCRTHLDALDRLIASLRHPQSAEQLRVALRAPHGGFPGGTVAELLQFAELNRLPLPYGSRPQLVLSELGHDMLRQLDERIDILDGKVDRLKTQTYTISRAEQGPLSGESVTVSSTNPLTGHATTATLPADTFAAMIDPRLNDYHVPPFPSRSPAQPLEVQPARPRTNAARLGFVAPIE